VVSLQEAVNQLGKDPRTVIKAIEDGILRGGAMPRPKRLRWYVYADALAEAVAAAAASRASDALIVELRAQIVSLAEANRLLIATQQELLDADRAVNDAAEKYRGIAQRYLDALGQFMVPGTIGDLADL
jgi:hypothetical protein